MSKKTYFSLLIVGVLICCAVITAGCCDTAKVEVIEPTYSQININSENTIVVYGQSINLTASQAENLNLEWELDDDFMGTLKVVSNNEAIFTPASKSGIVTITVRASPEIVSEIKIQVFAPPKLDAKIDWETWLEPGQNYKYILSYEKDGSVFVDSVSLVDEFGNTVSGLNTSRQTICIDETGTYKLIVLGHDFLNNSLRKEVTFSVMTMAEKLPWPADKESLTTFNPKSILATENYLKETLGIDVNLQKVAQNGKIVTGNGNSYVAFLFVRDARGLEDAYYITEVNVFDFYPKNTFKVAVLKSTSNDYFWTIAVGYSGNEYAQEISCVAAFPSSYGYFFDSYGMNPNVYSDDSSSFSGGGVSPGGSSSGPSPKPL